MQTALLILLVLLSGLSLMVLFRLERQLKAGDDPEEAEDTQVALMQRLDELEQLMRQLDPEPARQALIQLERSIALLEEGRVSHSLPYGGDLPRVAEVRTLVAGYLGQRGCDAVQILNPDAELDADRVEVRIETQRAGQVLKGTLLVDGIEVRETHLDSSFPLFP